MEFCTYWAAKGAEITIITPFKNDLIGINTKLPKGIKVDFPPFIQLKSNLHFMPFWRRSMLFLFFFFTAFWHILRMPKPDFIYASSSPLIVGLVAFCISKLRNIPYYFETVDLWPDVPLQIIKYRKQFLWIHTKFITQILYAIEKLIYINAKSIITLSEGMTEAIIKKGIDANKIYTIHNGTNTIYFIPCNNKKQAKIALGMHSEELIILYAGTIGIANGCESIIYAAEYLQKNQIVRAKFVFLGNGNDKVNIQKLTADLNLTNIKFIDSVPKSEVLRYFDAADIGLVTFAPIEILHTNSANKFFDYLAAGLPICTNYEGWQQDYLQKYHCGLSAQSNDSRQFTNNILELVNCKSLRFEMGMNGRKLAEEWFDRKILAEKVFNIFLNN